MKPLISFIIPTYNAEEYFDLCLQSIRNQNYPQDKIEILVIDGGSTDKTLDIAQKYSAQILVNEKKIAEYGKSIGIKASKGDYFVLFDSDNELVENNWLEKMVLAIEESRDVFGIESSFSHDSKLTSLDRYFARMRIVDPLAKLLASNPIAKIEKEYATILKFDSNSVIITGANGFIWNKKIVMETLDVWDGKFEEANYGTYLFNELGLTYGVSKSTSVRHYYCKGLKDFIEKRKKTGGKMKKRLATKQDNVWFKRVSKSKLITSVLYQITFVGPLIEAAYRSIKDKTFDWFWHPVINLITVIVYLRSYIQKQ